MRRTKFVFGAAATATISAGGLAAPITSGNLAIVRIGGTGGGAAASFVEEYTPGGTFVQSFALPTADNGAHQTCTMAGSATTNEGYLALSTDSQYLTLACNDMNVGTTVATSTLNRVVARMDLNGAIDTTTSFNLSSGWNARSAVMDGNNIWVSGSANTKAMIHTTFGNSSGTVISNTLGGSHVAKIYNGQLYDSVDSNTGTPQGIFTMGSGLPTTIGQAATQLPGFPATNNVFEIWDYWFADANTIFLADARAVASGGGLQKWVFNGSSWTQQYVMNAGLGAGVFGVTGVVNGGVTTIYATTADNKIVGVVNPDAPGASFNTLVTGVSGNAFRGIVLVPEPQTMLMFLFVLGCAGRIRRS